MLANRGASLRTTISPALGFAHRALNDGSVDSICMNCFLPISRSWGGITVTEKELVEIEAAHKCDESRESIRVITYNEVVAGGCNPADQYLTTDCEGNVNILASAFAHRYPDNGKVESICLKCLLTVSSCREVGQMIQEEAKHVCEPDRFDRRSRISAK